jgi:outer membrane immunogenic protein
MKKELLAATALSTATFSSLGPAAHAEAYNWSGFYAGAIAGVGSSNDSVGFAAPNSSAFNLGFVANTPRFFGTPFAAFSNAHTFTPWPSSIDAGHSYFSGGLEGGYNWQWGSVVLGIETDLSYLADGRGTGSFAATNTFSATATTAGTRVSMLSASAGVDWLYTVRPRVGYALDRTLIYATGGLAVGGTHLSTTASLDEHFIDTGKGPPPYHAAGNWTGSNSAVNAGFVIGGGGEYALTDHLTFKFEGLYYNLGRVSAAANGTGAFTFIGGAVTPLTVQPYTVNVLMDGFIARAGLNWRF